METKKHKFIQLHRLQRLENSIGYLSNYKGDDSEIHHIGESINIVDKRNTELLRELGEINILRDKLIKQLMNS
jgi:hypothetical protein